MKCLLAIASTLALLISGAALAIDAPFVYPRSVGTSSALVLAANQARKRIMFVNNSATAVIAVCPITSRVDSTSVTCTVNGAGSISLLPYDRILIEGPTSAGGSGTVGTAWNAIASGAASPLTILEWE